MKTANDVINILPYLYREHSIYDAIELYLIDINKLLLDINPDQLEGLVKQLRFFQTLLQKEETNLNFREDFWECYEYISKNKPDIVFECTIRRKSFLKFLSKVKLYLQKGKPIFKLKDGIGMRYVISSDSQQESVFLCYSIAEVIIDFFTKVKNYTLCLAEELNCCEGFNTSNFKDIYIPKKPLLSKNLNKYVKDYIFTPKADSGYQSLHIAFLDSYGNPFEVQIRTHEMDVRYSQCHGEYNEKKYGLDNSFVNHLDLSKIKMDGFSIDFDGTLKDNIGLIEPKIWGITSKSL